jgi:hypothetical protein
MRQSRSRERCVFPFHRRILLRMFEGALAGIARDLHLSCRTLTRAPNAGARIDPAIALRME